MWITLGAIFQENLVVNIYLNWQDLVWIRDYGDQEHWAVLQAMVSTVRPGTIWSLDNFMRIPNTDNNCRAKLCLCLQSLLRDLNVVAANKCPALL